MYKRIIAIFATVVITFMSFGAPAAKALSVGEVAYAYTQSDFAKWAVTGAFTYAGITIGGAYGTLTLPGIGTVEGSKVGAVVAEGAALGFNSIMEYLAEYPIDDAYAESEEAYLSTLDYTTITNDGLFSIYPHDWYAISEPGLNYTFNNTGTGLEVALYDGAPASNYKCEFNSTPLRLPVGRYQIVISFSSKGYIEQSRAFFSLNKEDGTGTACGDTYNPATGTVVTSSPFSITTTSYSDNVVDSCGRVMFIVRGYPNPVTVNVDYRIDCLQLFEDVDVDSGEESRTGTLMDALDAYNTGNSYVDNSTTINYFIGSVGSDGSVTDTYSPALYDEETLVFTEPVTGTQYQTKGWTYDYTSRSYYMTLDSGTMYIDGTEVTAVYLVYGDDNVEISYLSGSGATELIRTDTFAYVMVSQSACNINGHTNTVATTKEPTCTAAGERLYTCSVCGNQTVEAIPMIEHTYADYSIQQEPTCTNKGIAANTCTTCGGQITELLDPLGHDWLPTSITDESWAMPDGVSCPDCHGSEYSYTRSDYEIVTGGKNLFRIPAVDLGMGLVGNDDGSITVSSSATSAGMTSVFTLREFAPDLQVGRTYTLSAQTTAESKPSLFLLSLGFRWAFGSSVTITPEALASRVVFYTDSVNSSCVISNIQIEEGTVATEYEPYIETEVEIIPPIYNFTCSDCSTEWTAEAVYQHAYTTFTCSRCGETMIQSDDPDSGLFGSIANFISDGITWVTDKFVELTESLSGIHTIFRSYLQKIQHVGGDFPAMMGAAVACMPEDMMSVVWFGVIVMVVLAVYCKFFK